MRARKPYIAGNWKMNLDRKSAIGLVQTLRDRFGRRDDVIVAVFPPFVYLDEIVRTLAGSPIRVGAQNCCDEAGGAFTGEVSAAMLLDVGCDAVILGHSERRALYGEGDELINAKVRRALETGLEVILCVGETLEEREASRTEEVVRRQLHGGLSGVSEEQLEHLTIAYEPVWAIGTGRTASPAQAEEVHAYLRGLLSSLYSELAAETLRIQYGGSVKAENAAELLSQPDVDGALVGGASLQAAGFLSILDFQKARA
mgnify:CR=1 FL=1